MNLLKFQRYFIKYIAFSLCLSPNLLARYFEGLGWNTESHADYTKVFEEPEEFEAWALEKIDAGIPIMVDWVDWSGHWQVLIGIDTEGKDNAYDDVLIFADSYDVTDHYQDGYYTYPLGRWFYMWREGPCAAKETVMQQPYVAAAPKR
ncbi:MAG: papain-like cysteine protease family protein [Eubacteriales bacterium]|nr:papain-like cysteine protease family protein [Eubacteriales bacterium]